MTDQPEYLRRRSRFRDSLAGARGGSPDDSDDRNGWNDRHHWNEHDDWNLAVRGEQPEQRADRNFVELLQELRVLQTGIQILFALLLTVAFTSTFATADAFQRGVYVVTLTCSAWPSRC